MQPRTSPLDRTRLVDRSSAFLGRAWSKGWLPEPAIEAGELWAIAAKSFGGNADAYERAGRSEEDVADFRFRLEKLTASVVAEADLNPLGRAMAHGQLVRVIKQRLQFGALWSAKPALTEIPLAPPIIIIGHMRSGTTRVHRLLAADPAHSSTRFCDSWHPVPSKLHARRLWGGLNLTIARRLNPWIDALHPMSSGRVEEELGWLACALNHSTYQTQWHIPSYSAWSEARDAGPVYREFARILRTDAAHRNIADRPRVMKVPQFSEDLPSLLAEFPDARLVVAQRDSEDVLRSAVSIVANQMAIQCDNCDLDWIEQEWQRKLDLRDARMKEALENWDGPVAHLQFAALGDDWEREIARTYQALGIELSGEALLAMQREMASNESGHHTAHADQMAAFDQAPKD